MVRAASPRRSARLVAKKVDVKVSKGDNQTKFRKTAAVYVALMLTSAFGIYNLYKSVFPGGLSAQPGCERFWEALGFARASTNESSSIPQRVGIVWDCGEKVQGFGALAVYACLWICLKSLAIPGGMILCVALGGLVPPVQAQMIASFCEVVGGSLCYLLSGLIGEPLLQRFSPELLAKFREETERRRKRGDLFYFALFARQTPLIPNWFVNAASPLAGIPYPIFASTMMIGIQIATFLSIRTGALLYEVGRNSAKADSLLNGQAMQNFGILLAAQFVALIPIYLSPKDFGEENGHTPKKVAKKSKKT